MRAATGVRSAARWIGAEALAVAVGCIIVVGLAAWGLVALGRHQVRDLSAEAAQLREQIAPEGATVAELTKRGRRVRWNTCGRRLCFEASSNQGNLYDFRSRWTTDKGNVPLVIPRGH